jgi:hypothetical protein
MVGREKFLKCVFLSYINIKNHRKWESRKTKRNYKRVQNKGHNMRRILYGVSLPPPSILHGSGIRQGPQQRSAIGCSSVLPSNDHSAHLTREPTGSFIQ